MTIKSDLETSLKEAMREKNDIRRRTIRLALSSIKNAEIDKGSPLDEATMLSLIHKEIKNRRETISDAQKGNRFDLIDETEAEIKILQEFLPQGLSRDELIAIANIAIDETNAVNPSDMGKVMKVVMPRIQGRASGSEVSAIISSLLSPKDK